MLGKGKITVIRVKRKLLHFQIQGPYFLFNFDSISIQFIEIQIQFIDI